MPLEAKKTNFTVFSLNHELYNLIKSAFNMKLENVQMSKTARKADQVSLFETCIVLNRLNKSFLHGESIELQTKWAIIMSWRALERVNTST